MSKVTDCDKSIFLYPAVFSNNWGFFTGFHIPFFSNKVLILKSIVVLFALQQILLRFIHMSAKLDLHKQFFIAFSFLKIQFDKQCKEKKKATIVDLVKDFPHPAYKKLQGSQVSGYIRNLVEHCGTCDHENYKEIFETMKRNLEGIDYASFVDIIKSYNKRPKNVVVCKEEVRKRKTSIDETVVGYIKKDILSIIKSSQCMNRNVLKYIILYNLFKYKQSTTIANLITKEFGGGSTYKNCLTQRWMKDFLINSFKNDTDCENICEICNKLKDPNFTVNDNMTFMFKEHVVNMTLVDAVKLSLVAMLMDNNNDDEQEVDENEDYNNNEDWDQDLMFNSGQNIESSDEYNRNAASSMGTLQNDILDFESDNGNIIDKTFVFSFDQLIVMEDKFPNELQDNYSASTTTNSTTLDVDQLSPTCISEGFDQATLDDLSVMF